MITNDKPLGSIGSRDRNSTPGELAQIVLSLDDDSYPVDSDFLARLTERFASDPKLAVLTCFQITDEFPETIQSPDEQRGSRQLVASFPNSAAAIRREVYLNSSGFPSDLLPRLRRTRLRSCSATLLGFHVVYDPDLTIRHHFTPVGRSEARTHRRHARNELWSAAMRAPLILIPVVIPYRILSQLRYAFKRGISWAIAEPLWWLAALRGLPKCLRQRKRIPLADYRAMAATVSPACQLHLSGRMKIAFAATNPCHLFPFAKETVRARKFRSLLLGLPALEAENTG